MTTRTGRIERSRSCLDHLIILDEHHLVPVLREFVAYYNQDRLHRTLGPPDTRAEATLNDRSEIRLRAVLNGLHHIYERAA